MKVVKTACELCAWGCGIDAHVEKGRVVRIRGSKEHPLNRGRICPKGAAAVDYLYSKDRITTPMAREGDKWKKIDWDTAFEMVANNLSEVKEKYSAKSFATIIGMPILLGGSSTVGLIRRFMDVYGSPNCFSPESMCYRHEIIGYILTLGKFPVADVENSKCIIVWAHNPHASKPPLAWMIERAKKKGAKIIVIDPRRTRVAEMADIHARIRPGTDTLLALALMKVIMERDLYDKEFVSEYCHGFEQLRQHVSEISLDRVAEITWVDKETIEDIAVTFATTKPACIAQGVNALDQVPTGVQNARAVAMLHALTGNVDVKGGFARASRVHVNSLRLPELLDDIPLGIREHPLFYQVWETHLGEGQGMYLYNAILEEEPYPVKSLFIAGSNPVLTWPNSNRMREALEKVEFLTVMDLFMTETAKYADLFLPSVTFLERYELCDYYSVIFGIPYMILRKKVIEPLGESKSDVEFWLELAKRMGYREYFPWETVEEMLDYVLKPTGLTVKDLLDKYPAGLWTGKVKYGEYRERRFKTPSGKVELYSDTLGDLGYDPVPTFREPRESPLTDKSKEYPLILTTGARVVAFTHSQLRNVDKLRKLEPEAFVEINPETAGKYGIQDGDMVVIRTERGEIEIRARVTDRIAPGVINIPHGWDDANVNVLTHEKPGDPISGCPELKALLAKKE